MNKDKVFNWLISHVSAALILFVTLPAVAAGPALVFGVHPYLPAAELHNRFNPLVKYLSEQLATPVQLRISKNYETHIENVHNKIFDVAYMGPASYVELTKQYGKHDLLARLEINGSPFFKGYVITRQDSTVQELAQLKGKRFAFGSPHSTMSYLVPRHMLREAGVSLETLKGYKFMGNHRNVALGVLLGEFDAGAVKPEVFMKFREKGLRQLAISPPISEHVLVCRNGLPAQTCEAIREALYKLSKTEHGSVILTSIKKQVTGLVPASDKDYDNLRVIMR